MNHGHPVPLLELRHVSVTEGLSGRPLVQDVSFSLQRRHCLGIVGESGSGKSLLCRALLGLLPSGLVRSGQLHFDGRDLGRLDPAGWRELRGTGMAVILQQAMTAFDPLRPLGKQLEGTLRDRGRMSAARAREAVCEALQRVDLPETVLSSYPHQLSGGMLQRCMTALTLALRPALVVADEPTTALDACHQQQVLRCLADVARDASLIFVSHDFGAVQQLADEVLVMQAGLPAGSGRQVMSGSDIFLAVRDIWKTYAVPHGGGSRPVLRGLDFCLERGEMAGLVGESGSGKSTLARLLLGLERPDRGIVLLEGQPLRQWRARGGRLSVVFQDYVTSVDPGFTLAEAVDEGLGPGCRLSRRERRREVDRLLERVGLSPSLSGRLPHELSGGQVQRACIARALAARPSFLVLDEAVSSLDVPVQVQILELLRDIRSDMTCLFITHDLQAATLVCDSLLVLDQGRCAEHLPVSQLGSARSPRLRRMLETVVPFRSAWDGSCDEAAGTGRAPGATKV